MDHTVLSDWKNKFFTTLLKAYIKSNFKITIHVAGKETYADY